MADIDDSVQIADSGDADIEMGTNEDPQDGDEDNAEGEGDHAGVDDDDETLQPNGSNALISPKPQTQFLDYLKSPIVELVVGTGDDQTILTAHRAILTASPFFSDKLADGDFAVELPDESLDAIGCFLYNDADELESDPTVPAIDDTGAQLLKHARVYTLAQKFDLLELKTLAHSKIHRINSTAVGEIAYARFVYGNTPPEDTVIRKPVAAFWATRSHVLRHEAEAESKSMCLEFPQFGFDVLSLVLASREKRARGREEEGTPGSLKGRKRMRPSVNV